MKKVILRFIQQYFICKHEESKVVRKIKAHDDCNNHKWFEKLECKTCDRKYYSDYFYEFNGKRYNN